MKVIISYYICIYIDAYIIDTYIQLFNLATDILLDRIYHMLLFSYYRLTLGMIQCS